MEFDFFGSSLETIGNMTTTNLMLNSFSTTTTEERKEIFQDMMHKIIKNEM